MIKITYAEALKENYICVVTGEEIGKLHCRDKRNEFRLEHMKMKTPMKFSKINTVFHRELECIEYIRIWKKINIYKIEEV